MLGSFFWKNSGGKTKLVSGDSSVVAFQVDKEGYVEIGSRNFVDVTVTAAQLKALNATPKTLVVAPGAGKALLFDGMMVKLTYGTAAYGGIAAGEDMSVKYTDASGAEVAQCETTGFLDQTADGYRYVRPQTAASGSSAFTIVPNAALVLHMLSGEITTGDSPLYLRVFYRVVKTALPVA